MIEAMGWNVLEDEDNDGYDARELHFDWGVEIESYSSDCKETNARDDGVVEGGNNYWT